MTTRILRRGSRPAGTTHILLAKTAKEMAGEWYESAAHDNSFYAKFPDQETFIKYSWPKFIEDARTTLAGMLARIDVAEGLKEEIMCALIADSDFREGRARNGIGFRGSRPQTRH